MQSAAAQFVRAGREALEAGDWLAARGHYQDAVDAGETAEALHGLAHALFLTLDYPAAIEHYERAYAAYRAECDSRAAVHVARSLAFA